MTRLHGILIMFASAFAVSFSGLIFRKIEKMEIFEIVFVRSFALVVVIFIILLFLHKSLVLKKIFSIGWSGLFASFCIGAAMTTYLFAFTYTTVANTLFTLCATPFIAAILAFTNHDFRDISIDIEDVYKRIKNMQKKYKNVVTINSDAVKAMQETIYDQKV